MTWLVTAREQRGSWIICRSKGEKAFLKIFQSLTCKLFRSFSSIICHFICSSLFLDLVFSFWGGFKKIFISLRKLIRFRKMIKSGVTLCFLHSLVQLSTWRWTTVSASNNPPSVSRAQVMLQRSLGLWSPVANWMYLSPLKLFTVSIFNRYLHDLKSLYAFLAFQKIELSIKK